jgi:hypothetical protein
MTPVLRWIKAHIVIVVCAVVMIAAPIVAWMLSEGMNEELRTRMAEGTSKVGELDRLKKSSVTLEVPGGVPIRLTTVINQPLLDAYEKAVGKISGEATQIHTAGLAQNRDVNGSPRGKDDIISGMFPAPRANEAETLPFEMYDALIAAYQRLLSQTGAGAAPDPEQVSEQIAQRRYRRIGQLKGGAGSSADLDDESMDKLTSELTDARLNLYRDYVLGESKISGGPSGQIRFYADLGSLALPARPSSVPDLATLFGWQWNYWIAQDVLWACSDANEGKTAINGPVKRMVSLNILPLGEEGGSTQRSGNSGGGGGGMMGGMGGGGGQPGRRGGNSSGGGAANANPNAGVGMPKIDPTREAKIDYSASMSGRSTNEVYDVRIIELKMIVSTSGLPEFMDALAKRNFMTILDVSMRPANAFTAARNGYIYGVEPISEVSLRIESIWLREWTAETMPAGVRDLLGIKSDPPKTADMRTSEVLGARG